MGNRITWEEENLAEDGHRVYRDTSPMDPESLPSPLATVGPDVTSYDDGTAVTGTTYYYRVSAYVGGVERVSDEVSITTSDSGVPTLGEQVRFTMDSISGSTLTDAKGLADGTIVGTVTTGTGIDGNSLSFDGVNNYVQFGATEILELNAFAVCFWVKTSGLYDFFSRVRESGSDVAEAILFRNNDNTGTRPHFRVVIDTTLAGQSDGVDFLTDFSDGNWHFIGASYGPSGHKLFVDGFLDNSTSEYIGPIPFQSGTPFEIGRDVRDILKDEWLVGEIDQFRFFDRELDESHMVMLYEEFTGGI